MIKVTLPFLVWLVAIVLGTIQALTLGLYFDWGYSAIVLSILVWSIIGLLAAFGTYK